MVIFQLWGAAPEDLEVAEDRTDFDEAYYLHMYPDVADAVRAGHLMNAEDHWLRYGRQEGRSPSLQLAGERTLIHHIREAVGNIFASNSYGDDRRYRAAVGDQIGAILSDINVLPVDDKHDRSEQVKRRTRLRTAPGPGPVKAVNTIGSKQRRTPPDGAKGRTGQLPGAPKRANRRSRASV